MNEHTQGFIDTLTRSPTEDEKSKDVTVSAIQIAYLTYCKMTDTDPVSMTELTESIMEHYQVGEPKFYLLNPDIGPVFENVKMNVPDQDTEQFKVDYIDKEREFRQENTETEQQN